jgi:hypothetical protein
MVLTNTWLVPVVFYKTILDPNYGASFHVLLAFLAYFSMRYWFPAQPWPRFRRWVLSLDLASRFPEAKVQVVRRSCMPTLYLWHPDACLGVGFLVWGLCSPLLEETRMQGSPDDPVHLSSEPEVTWLVPEELLRFPVVADVLRWLGCVPYQDATLVYLLSERRNVCVLLGRDGGDDATVYDGYIKRCMRVGYQLCPIVTRHDAPSTPLICLNNTLRELLWKLCIPADNVVTPYINFKQPVHVRIPESTRITAMSRCEASTVVFYRNCIATTLGRSGRLDRS